MSTRRERNKPQINKQLLEIQTESKEHRKDENLIELGKYFYNLSGLVFGGEILTIVLNFKEEKVPLLLAGLLSMFLTAMAGWTLIKRGNNK